MIDHARVTNKPQKLQIGKKKNEDNLMNSKGMSNYNSNGSKSLGKSKISTKVSHASNNSTSHNANNPRHASIEKGRMSRDTATKTQTGFYVAGGGVIVEKFEEEQDSGYFKQPSSQQNRNQIYNVKSPKSRKNYRKSNLNTEEIIEEDNEGASQSSSQLPLLVMATQKSGEHRNVYPIHQIPHQMHNVPQKPYHSNVPNILITNSTFNYRH